jgi:outer membrane protein TolC
MLLLVLFYSTEYASAQERQALQQRQLTLDEVIQLAILNNLDLKMVQKDSAIASENILNAKMARAPYIGTGINYNYIGNPVLYRDFYSNDTTIGYYNHQAGWNISASVPIYTGGAIRTQIEQEIVAGQIRNEILKMTEAQVRLLVINQFYNLYKLYRQVEIIDENIKNVKVNIQQLNSRVKNGQNLVSDLTRTELQLSNFEIDVFRTWNNIDLLSNYLCIYTGIPTSTRLIPKDVIVQIPEDSLVYATCLEEAFRNRFEIRQAELQKNYSELSYRMTKTALLPEISGIAGYNSNFPVPGTFPPQTDILNYWVAGVGIRYNISGLYNLNHRKLADKLQIEKETVNVENVKNSIDQELKSAYINFIESKKNIVSYMKNVELATLNYKIVKSKYDNEFALIIDMIDAELQVNDAKLSLNNAIIDAINQYYSLLYAMGKLK